LEPTSPYPSIIIADNSFHVYVDYHLVTETTSPGHVLALILSMFSIFELSFAKNARVLRFLYAIIFGAQRYLSNVMRKIIQEKAIDVYHPKDVIMSYGSSSSNPSIPSIIPSKPTTDVILPQKDTRQLKVSTNIEQLKSTKRLSESNEIQTVLLIENNHVSQLTSSQQKKTNEKRSNKRLRYESSIDENSQTSDRDIKKDNEFDTDIQSPKLYIDTSPPRRKTRSGKKTKRR